MSRLITACGLLATLMASPAHPAPSRIATLATAPDRITFDVQVPSLALQAVEGEDGLVAPVLEDYGPTGPVGAPGMPSRVLTVAIPPDGEVRVSAFGAEPRVQDGVLLAPVPMVYRDGREAAESYVRDPAAYAATRVGSGARARLLQTAWIRNQRVAQIAIEPADYDAVARRLTVWARIHVEVSVAPARVGPPAERHDPFEGVYRSVLVNYEQGRSWRRPAGRVVPARERRAGSAAAAAAQAVPDTSVFVGRNWVKILVTRPGLYKLDYVKVRSFAPFQNVNTPWTNVRLFNWPGYPVLPEESYCDSCDYREVPFGISDEGGDNAFHTNNDYLYFYALGPADWASTYDPTWPDSSYINHPYETTNAYFLTASTALQPIPGAPKRIQFTAVDADTTLPALQWSSVPARLHLESENEYYQNSPPLDGGTIYGLGTVDGLVWQKWFWITVGPGDTRSTTFDLPGLDTSQPAAMHIRLWGLTFPAKGFTVINHAVVTLQGNGDLTIPEVTWLRKTSVTLDTSVTHLKETGNTLVLNSPARGDNAPSRVGLGFIEARYQRKLAPVNDTLTFDVPATGQRTLLRVGPFSSASAPMLFDITDANTPLQVNGASYDTSSKRLVFAVDGSRARRFIALPSFGFVPFPLGSVIAASPVSQTNLRRLGADYLVIYYDEFAAAAESLATWRAGHLPLSGVPAPYVTRTLPISAIYDQFSGGRADPLAVRNFLRASFYAGDTVGTGATGGRRISYVSFLGDASYDFKNIYRKAGPGQPGCLLPTYENGYDGGVEGGRKFTTDDWLANVDDASVTLPDIFTGRIPVSDAAQAMDVVRNKVLFYERSAPLGADRNRVLLIADDNTQCDAFDAVGWGHVLHTADIDSTAIPKHIDRVYVYLHKFPRASAQSCLKPSARAAIQAAINEGVLLMNFVGHGSPFQLADEQVLIQSDVGTLVNGPRYPVVCTWSCDVGLFDDPLNLSLGERLLLQAGGGSMGVISSTELALSGFNESLNRLVFQKLFERDSLSGQYESTLAEALVTGKILGSRPFGFLDPTSIRNNVKYQLLGDGAAKLNLPHLWVETTLTDSSGNPITTLPRGSLVRFNGRVVESPGGPAVPIRGQASVLIEDSAPREQAPANFPVEYYTSAGPIFRGSTTIDNGMFAGAFVVPLEARLGPRARARSYIGGRGTPGRVTDDDGVGVLGGIGAGAPQPVAVVPGTGTLPDSTGPVITLSFPGGATEVRPDAVLEIRITDPSGILITDHVPQNGIIVTIDDNTTSRVDVTSTFRYEDGSYQSGSATFKITGLPLGPHKIEVSAADNLAAGFSGAAHRSSATIAFVVVETPDLRVTRAYLYPDPACSRCPIKGGQFLVDVPGDSVNVLLRVYTVSGRLIRTLTSPRGAIGRVEIPWDGLDEEHQPLANGVYLFRVNVNDRESDGKSSARLHATGDGRFVILNR